MKVTVFGGSGFLGSHVCDKLSDAGYEVTVFDLVPSKWLRAGQKMIVGDILDEQTVFKAVEGAAFVFNFAGIADIDEAKKSPLDTVRFNVLGNTVVLEACRRAQIERYVFASSVYVYSQSGSFYRCSKQSSELYIEAFHECYGLDYTILRYGSLYGPRADSRNAIYRFVHEALSKGEITYPGSPAAIREYIHVEDAARSSVEILKADYNNQHIILTGHQPMKVSDLLRMIAEMVDHEVEVNFLNSEDATHYEITPYSFHPRVGKKLTPPLHVDMGQGVLRTFEEVHRCLNPDMHYLHDVIVRGSEGSA